MSSAQPIDPSDGYEDFTTRQLETIRSIFRLVVEETMQSKGKKPDRPEGSNRGRSPRRTPSEERPRQSKPLRPQQSSRRNSRDRNRSRSRPCRQRDDPNDPDDPRDDSRRRP